MANPYRALIAAWCSNAFRQSNREENIARVAYTLSWVPVTITIFALSSIAAFVIAIYGAQGESVVGAASACVVGMLFAAAALGLKRWMTKARNEIRQFRASRHND